ncbi:MAG: transglycosylase SLT domain-containing protein [Saprospiraceae bacterium]|nr:transglycosylase SLT domain-containing protein [Saprospiraceae bacterium]MCF8252102.1 transglycosylase SLT domain-containing protein [Saprospiraceae bacterium]MCF8282459.1 transglycosylase SLT domain-containing protein [Bacteroidales bacterium]MCF8313745.1 transglycosylase SLT domain-containing protein [Saprospiraceae bacterium]MCF8442448.1 transglycosylase SLT domain-containing protein [Saprospiraceae bacterium]
MESSCLRQLLASLFLLLLFSPLTKANTTFNSDEIRPRFEAMDCMIAPRYTSEVESYIKRYLAYNGSQASRVMARAAVYFPIYERYLKEHDLPQDLKYLSIVESALNPNAVSPVGAKGLWQFMSQTGRNYDLTIDKNVDERSCPYNSTEAAMQYLAKQFDRFGNWELAIASYNCGAGTIMKAMKRGRSDNYWKISKYLPRETRNFVPAFLGAAYIANFYHLHDIEPEYPSLDLQVTEALKVYEKLDFSTIAAITGLPIDIVEEMNPAYKKDFIPEKKEGYDLILPSRVSSAIVEYLEARRPDNARNTEIPPIPDLVDMATYNPDELYFYSTYVVAEGDKIGELADIFNVAPYNLKVWNKLTTYQLKKGQELIIWFPNEFHHFLPKEERIDVQPVIEMVNDMMIEAAPEEVILRDDRPVPDGMPFTTPHLKLKSVSTQNMKMLTVSPVTAQAPKATFGDKVSRMVAPLRNFKIKLPKLKPAATPAPKKAPIAPKRATELNGHGII